MARCPICGARGFIGRADDPSVQFCVRHAAELDPDERALFLLPLRPLSSSPAPPPAFESIDAWTPLAEAAGAVLVRACLIRGCPYPTSPKRAARLCDAHYELVSDERVGRQIAKDVVSRWWEK